MSRFIELKNASELRGSSKALYGKAYSGYHALAQLHGMEDHYGYPSASRMLEFVVTALRDKKLCTPRAHKKFWDPVDWGSIYGTQKGDE